MPIFCDGIGVLHRFYCIGTANRAGQKTESISMKTAGFIAAIAVAATAVTAGVALADGHGKGKHGARHSFEDLDLDGNGEVTMEEMIQHREARFKAADTDGDGFLS
jgi:Spy/CpxP family protein refolding chaperone